MIWWVYQEVSKVKKINQVIVATDDERIANVCEEFQMSYIMTKNNHVNHICRIAEVSEKIEADYYVCVNGDEPLIKHSNINDVIPNAVVMDDIFVQCLYRDLYDPVETMDSSNVKACILSDGRCIYLSRSIVPFPKGTINFRYKKLVGIECFNKKALDFYYSSEMGDIEKIEDIDHLRFIEHGVPLILKRTESESLSVDTKNDLEKVRRIMSQRLNS